MIDRAIKIDESKCIGCGLCISTCHEKAIEIVDINSNPQYTDERKKLGSNDLIQYFVNVIEAKDPYTQGHSHHVKVIVEAIYDCLPTSYKIKLDKGSLLTAALLHDIGKISTPDNILNKDDALDEEEWLIMRQHPLNGKKIIDNTMFSYMDDWILYHHERIDGCGYYGLNGREIPLESRIIAIADTFSALRTYRIYRPAKSLIETTRILRENAETQLDAEILDYFLSIDMNILATLECNCDICRHRRRSIEEKLL